jgi:hypothetical protein
MSKAITHNTVPVRRRWALTTNTMGFPRELREAIPDLPTCVGRVLKIDSVSGDASHSRMFGPSVHLKLVVKETGKLSGEFVIRMDLEAGTARALSETLAQLAEQAEKAK